MQKHEFDDFFRSYSENVDNANQHGFWKLSDRLIQEIIVRTVGEVTEETVILDAGGGTGRWVCDLSKILASRFVIYDLSEDMLRQAKKNITEKRLEDRVSLVHGDLINMEKIESNSIDHVISIYSPVSFIDEYQKFFSELYRITKKGGKVVVMGHGFYNSLYSKVNNYNADVDELKNMVTRQVVKWAPYVPELHTFSKEVMEENLQKAGFNLGATYGVPVFAQPGPEDFDPKNSQKSAISQRLEDDKYFSQIVEMEMKYNHLSSVANRGMNIFSVGIK